MGIRRPKYVAGVAQAISNSAAAVYGAAYDVLGYNNVTFDILDAGSGGNLTVQFFGVLDPAAAAPTVITNLAKIGADLTVVANTRVAFSIQGAYKWILVSMQHASSAVNVTMNVEAVADAGGGEW
jgi:hypothetical protein